MKMLSALVVVLALALSACTTSKEEEPPSESTPVTESRDGGATSAPAPDASDDGAPAPEAPDDGQQAPDDDGEPAPEASDDGQQVTDDDGSEPEEEEPEPTGPGTLGLYPVVVDERAPGVTDDAVKIGIMYPDLTTVGPMIGVDHGDYEAAFEVAFDQVNSAGGIHGRMLVPVFAPVDPLPPDAGTAACTFLTEDEDVFLAVGSFIGDDVLCFVETHETPLLGGWIDAESHALARTLWFTTEAGEGLALNGIQAIVRRGTLSGKVGIAGAIGNEELYETQVKPILDANGVDVAEIAYLDTDLGANDPNALYAMAETVALRFESEDIDQILFLGGAEAFFPVGLARTGYRPQLIITNFPNALVYINGEGNDLSVLEGAIAVGAFDPDPVFRQLGSPTKECVESQESGLGVVLLSEAEQEEGDPAHIVSSFTACRYTGFVVALLEAAGPDLNRGALITAAHNLGEIMLTGSDDPWYFDKDHPEGIRPVVFYNWDVESAALVAE